MNEQRLSFLFRSPEIVESAVRAALGQTLAVRRYGGGEIDARTFGNRTLDELRAELGRRGECYDALGKYELDVVAVRAASRFFSSGIGRRLLTIEPAHDECDAAVRDEHGRLHVVRIEVASNDERRVELGRRLTRYAEARPSLHAPRVHFYSLRDARLRSFTFGRRSAAAA
jgi:ribosomal protein S18 acetylase RimI-like enzyme